MHGDIADAAVAAPLVQAADYVVHFAAETHVDRSIREAGEFIKTDVIGTFVLLEAARQAPNLKRFVQISTDEVYGSVPEGSSRETDELRPRNPYSASKAGADRLAYSFWATYGVPVIVTRASNNYGPNQFPEKVIPLFITNLIDGLPVPLYGDGQNVRDWLHVEDHCRGVDLLLTASEPGEVYNIGGGNEVKNVDLTHRLLELVGRPDVADPAGQRSARATIAGIRSTPRSCRRSAGGRSTTSRRAWPRRSPGTARTSGGGARSRNRTPPSRPTTRRSTPSAASSDRRRGPSPARSASSSPAAPASPRGTCSIGC